MKVAEIGATKVTSDRFVAPTCGRIEYITMKVTEVSPIPIVTSAASAVAPGAAGMPSTANGEGGDGQAAPGQRPCRQHHRIDSAKAPHEIQRDGVAGRRSQGEQDEAGIGAGSFDPACRKHGDARHAEGDAAQFCRGRALAARPEVRDDDHGSRGHRVGDACGRGA